MVVRSGTGSSGRLGRRRRRGARAVALTLACAVCLAACGSSGPATTEADAIARLRETLTSYNAATATDIASTGARCREALDGLGQSSLLATPTVTASDASTVQALKQAYLSARAGFADCAAGASRMDYRLMARSDTELAAANSWLARARGTSVSR